MSVVSTVFKMNKKLTIALASFLIINLCLMLSGCYRLYKAPRFTTPAYFVRVTNNSGTAVGVRIVWEALPGSGAEKKFFLKPTATLYQQGRVTILPSVLRVALEITGCGVYSFPNFEKKQSSRVFVDLRADLLGNLVCQVNVEYANTLVSDGVDVSNIYSPS